MAAYAAATATVTSFEKIRAAATGGEDNKTAKTTAQGYRDALARLFILDEVPGWQPSRNHIAQLAQRRLHFAFQILEPPRMVKHNLPGVGQLEVFGQPVNQLDAQFCFQPLDGKRHRGLRAGHLLRGPRKALLGRNGNENLEGVKFQIDAS